MNDAMLHLCDRPGQEVFGLARCLEIESRKLIAKGREVQSWRDRASGDALMGGGQRAG